MPKEFLLGCHGRGATHIAGTPISVDERFRLVKESGVFDFFDRLPQPGEEKEYLKASQKYGLPIKTGLWTYHKGKDEAKLIENLKLAREAGGEIHNVMLYTHHADGHPISDQEVAAFYLYAYEEAQKAGIDITFEIHIEMWSEDFRLALDPFEARSIYDDWLAENILLWASMRPVAPNGPKNAWAKHPDGRAGRACQYPFLRPRPGEWHSPWYAYKLEPSKEITRKVLRDIRDNPQSRIRFITTEIIDLPDYGDGAKYSLFEHNAAMAAWIRQTWDELRKEGKK